MLTKRLSDLTSNDIEALAGVSESRHLDFKSAPVGGQDKDKREFLADVTAFANASGGDIIFGVEEQEGVACAFPGIRVENSDSEKLRLDNLIRTGTEPRLTHFDLHWLSANDGAGFLIVRIPRSWTAPHRVTLQGHDKFYIRNSAGKHPMNTDELRGAFTLSQTIVERMRGFRAERVEMIHRDEGPFALKPGSKLIFHGIPLGAFVDPPNLTLNYETTRLIPPFGSGGHSHQHTLEGIAAHSPAQVDGVRAYTLAFRSGIVEGVADLAVERVNGGHPVIGLVRLEQYIMEGWAALLRVAQHYDIDPPFYVFISILGIGNVVPRIPENRMLEVEGAPYRRNNLLLPEFEVSRDRAGLTDTILFKSAFDQIANGFGLYGSLNYGADGRYIPRR